MGISFLFIYLRSFLYFLYLFDGCMDNEGGFVGGVDHFTCRLKEEFCILFKEGKKKGAIALLSASLY